MVFSQFLGRDEAMFLTFTCLTKLSRSEYKNGLQKALEHGWTNCRRNPDFSTPTVGKNSISVNLKLKSLKMYCMSEKKPLRGVFQ